MPSVRNGGEHLHHGQMSLVLIRAVSYRTLLSVLDDCGLWLNSLLLDVSPSSICGIFTSGLSGGLRVFTIREITPEDAAYRWRRNVEQKRIKPLPLSPANRVLQ